MKQAEKAIPYKHNSYLVRHETTDLWPTDICSLRVWGLYHRDGNKKSKTTKIHTMIFAFS